MRASVLLVALASILWKQSIASPLIRCESKESKPIVINLNAMHKFSKTLDCISADFIADMTPCAPNGGYGLSAPTGSGALTRVVTRWQDYADHDGGVVGHFMTESQIYFSGGWMDRNLERLWEFRVDRITGNATLTTHDARVMGLKNGTFLYACRAATKKF
jgi:hypothetical protein